MVYHHPRKFKTMNDIHLVCVDMQRDFCDPKGALYVKNAEKDCQRVADMITKHGDKIDSISLTMDSHAVLHLAHTICWLDSNGNQPSPFTVITYDDMVSGKYRAKNPAWQKRYLEYLKNLSAKGLVHVLWPRHCVVGSDGWSLHPLISDAVIDWETKYFGLANYWCKANNIFSEHFGVCAAEVPSADDPTTNLNTAFIRAIEQSSRLLISGEASSHCVKRSVEQIATEFGEQHAKKIVLLTDTMSPVPSFEKAEEEFFKYAKSIGIQFSTSTTFFK